MCVMGFEVPKGWGLEGSGISIAKEPLGTAVPRVKLKALEPHGITKVKQNK